MDKNTPLCLSPYVLDYSVCTTLSVLSSAQLAIKYEIDDVNTIKVRHFIEPKISAINHNEIARICMKDIIEIFRMIDETKKYFIAFA